MNGPYPGNWQNSLRGIAATAVLVAIGLYIAITLIQAIARPLIEMVVVTAVLYGVVRFERYRRSRW